MRVAANYHEPSSSAIAMKAVDIAMTLIARDRISFCTARCCSVLTNRACSAIAANYHPARERPLSARHRTALYTQIQNQCTYLRLNTRGRASMPVGVTVIARLPSDRLIHPRSRKHAHKPLPTVPAMCGRRSLQSKHGRQNTCSLLRVEDRGDMASRSTPSPRRKMQPSGVKIPPSLDNSSWPAATILSAIDTASSPARWS